MRRTTLALTLLAVLLMPGCVEKLDATFVNPCAVEIEVATWFSTHAVEDPLARFSVPAESAVTVEDALQSPSGAVTIEGTDEEIDFNTDELPDNNVVVVPATFCEDLEG